MVTPAVSMDSHRQDPTTCISTFGKENRRPPLYLGSFTRPRVNTSPVAPFHVDVTVVATVRVPSPALTEATNASAYYTPLSVGEQVDETFQRYRRPQHPNTTGRRNLYPYHGPLSDVEEENPWDGERSRDAATMLLRRVEPQPLEGFEQLRQEDRSDSVGDW
jgi:hypothetical protein